MARTDINTQQPEIGVIFGGVAYSRKSTIAEIIKGLGELKEMGLLLENNPSLKEAIEYVFGILNEDIKRIENNIEKIIGVLESVPSEQKEKTILDFEKEKISEVIVESKEEEIQYPKSKFDKMKLDELVAAYDEAQLAKNEELKGEIAEIIARYENIKVSQVTKFIETQKILKKGIIDLEKMVQNPKEEKAYIKLIQNNIGVEESKAEELLRDVEVGIADDKVSKMLEKTTNLYQDPNIKKIVSHSVEDFILGVTTKVEGLENIMEGQEIKKIELETMRFVEENKKTVLELKAKEIDNQFRIAAANAPENYREEIIMYGEAVREFYSRGPNLSPYKDEAVNSINEEVPSLGRREEIFEQINAVTKAAHTQSHQLEGIIEKVSRYSGVKKYLPNIKEVRSFQGVVDMFDKNPAVMKGLHQMVNSKIRMIEWASKLPGVGKYIGGASDAIGGVAMKEFMVGAMKVMAEQGMLTGGKAILQGIISGTVASTETAAGSTLLASTLTAFGEIPVIGQILLIIAAIIFTFNNIIRPIVNAITDFFRDNLGVNLWGIRDFFADNLHLGKGLGTMAQFGFNAVVGAGVVLFGGLTALFGPILALGLASMTALITPVVIFFGVGMLAYNLLVTTPMISSLVPPPPLAAGGTCQPKDQEEESGKINCNRDAPEANIGISKEDFGKFADDWNGGEGTNYARECFNDVVNRAKCAGIVPEYALWAWLHESGASNYSIADVEDFGIHGSQSVPTKNFDLQIKAFLKLNPAKVCIDDPRVGGNYWLAFSINYLLGDDPTDPSNSCNPDRADANGNTGRKYEAELRDSWSRLGSPPASIYSGSPGGQNCNGSSTENPNEYVRADGVLMVCDGPVDENGNFIGQPGGGAYDPNSPPLVGEIVSGECSVSKSVKLTKQCGEPWSNKGLPGGSGTICSAGCGPSSVSSILRTKNGSYTPDTVIFENGSPYGGMNNDGSSLGQARDSLKMHGFTESDLGNVGGCSQKDIANWICQGKAVIILSDSYTGSGGGTIGHILPVVAVSGGKLITKDPYYSNQTPFVTEGGIKAGQIKTLRECLPVQLKKD